MNIEDERWAREFQMVNDLALDAQKVGKELTREKEPKLIGYLDPEQEIKVYRTEHYIWKQRDQLNRMAKKTGDGPWKAYASIMPQVMGRWHYYYDNGRGKRISLVNTMRGLPGKGCKRVKMDIPVSLRGIPGEYYTTFWWEICSGGSCEGCADANELFATRKEAEVRILKLLK